jgi:monofunctional chorismate mutase
VKHKLTAFLFSKKVMQLEINRNEIDRIDSQILELLNRRANIVRTIGEVKIRAGMPIVDWRREAEIIGRMFRETTGPLEGESLARIYMAILRESREIQFELSKQITTEGAASA